MRRRLPDDLHEVVVRADTAMKPDSSPTIQFRW
jgi:hypothetical protein